MLLVYHLLHKKSRKIYSVGTGVLDSPSTLSDSFSCGPSGTPVPTVSDIHKTKRTPVGVLNLCKLSVIAKDISALKYGKNITFVFVGIIEN